MSSLRRTCSTLVALFLFRDGLAQQISDLGSTSNFPHAIAFTFSDPGQTSFCGYRPGEAGSSFTVRFEQLPETLQCFELQDLAEQLRDEPALVGGQYFNTSANYSQLAVSIGDSAGKSSSNVGELFFEVSAESSCDIAREEQVFGYEWNCGAGDVSCAKLRSGVRSFQVGRTDQTVQDEQCVRASLPKSSAMRVYSASAVTITATLFIVVAIVGS